MKLLRPAWPVPTVNSSPATWLLINTGVVAVGAGVYPQEAKLSLVVGAIASVIRSLRGG